MSAEITRIELLSQLVVNGALRMVAGDVQGKSPVEGVVLSPEERAKAGISPERLGLFYPAEQDGVFMDMGGATATLWLSGGDCSRALQHFETALKRAYPAARQVDDTQNPSNEGMRSRAFEVNLGPTRNAVIDVAYPKPGGAQRFAVRVFAQQRQDR